MSAAANGGAPWTSCAQEEDDGLPGHPLQPVGAARVPDRSRHPAVWALVDRLDREDAARAATLRRQRLHFVIAAATAVLAAVFAALAIAS